MLKLRGLSGDCAANPNDPVCIEFYGTVPPAPSGLPTGAPMPGLPSRLNPNLLNTNAQIMTAPGTAITFPTSMLPDAMTPWYKSWIGLAALGAAGYFGYKYLYKPGPKKAAAPATAPAVPVPSGSIAGLFSVRYRRRSRRR